MKQKQNDQGRVYCLIPAREGNGARIYVGSYLLTNTPKDDSYYGSCEDPRYLTDRSQGKLKFIWLTSPIPIVEARNVERQILSFYNAMHNPKFYNSSNGGGAGVDSSFRCDPDDFKRMCDIIEGVEVETPTIESCDGIADAQEMEELAEKVRSGYYPVTEVSVTTTMLLDRTQPRYYSFDRQHLAELNDSFSNPEKARKYLTPIVIIINDETGEHEEVPEGSHRLDSANTNGWVTIPAVLLKRSLFKGKRENIIHFGNAMNNKVFHQKGNTNDDLIKRIRMLSEKFPDRKASSEDFKKLAIQQFGRLWSEGSIRYYCDEHEKYRKEEKLKADINFISYSKKELSQVAHKLKYDNPESAIEVQKIDRITNAGFGGILRLMTTGKKKNGIILVHYPTVTLMSKQKKELAMFSEMLKLVKSQYDIQLKFLDPFNKYSVLDSPPKK